MFSRHIALQTLDGLCYICYNSGMNMNEEAKTPRNIRIRPSFLHQARVAAVMQKKTLGRWLEEAIVEKIDREQKRE
jgi:predicted HicB family RNase H-like nuclease